MGEEEVSSTVSEKLYDMVVFGASGVTGAYVVEELAKVAKQEKITWAIAGRNEKKLIEVLKNAAKHLEIPEEELLKTPIIIADVANKESLEKMCRDARLILNCVGPYRFFGEQVVAAAVKEKASHLDVSGEPQYLESMLLKYHKKAKESGIYIIGSCGFDSIPCDVGISYLKEKFDGDLNAVETYLSLKPGGDRKKQVNFGTWQSAIHGVANLGELKNLRKMVNKEIFTKPLPKQQPRLKKRSFLFKSEKVGTWCLPFLGSDKTVSIRTQLHQYNDQNERPTQIQCYLQMPSFFTALMTIFMALVFVPLCFTKFGRYLLEKYPEFFSFGLFTKRGPTREELKNDSFQLTIYGEGWSSKLAEPTDAHTNAPDKTAKVIVKGPDPAYITTSACVVHAGLCVLKEKDKLPKDGGVYTPGYSFAKTSLVDRLSQHGVKFEFSAGQ